MNIPAAVLGLVVVVVILVFLIPLARRSESHETFLSPKEYRDAGRSTYNQFADTIDISRPNFAHAESNAELKAATRSLSDVMNTADLETSPDSLTLQGVIRDAVTAQVPPTNKVLGLAKHCAKVRGRIAGSMFTDPSYKECGICLKGGTNYDNSQAGKYMGGLYIMNQDRTFQEAEAKSKGSPAHYSPTVGDCAPDQFYATKAAYEKGLNQLDCKESGESGGFNGSTADGRKVAAQKCAQAPFSGGNVFIYDPKNRAFNVNLRVITPIGTGLTRVIVKDARGNQVGFGSSKTPGKEFIVTINNATELQDLSVFVAMEVPHRKSGNKEVFQYRVNEGSTRANGYNQSRGSSEEICSRIGARSATKNEMVSAMNNGAQVCSSGWASDFLGLIMQASNPMCGPSGIVDYKGSWNNLGMSWCNGIKPPNSTRQEIFYTYVHSFFESLAGSTPSQAEQPYIWSEHGDKYQAPYFRGVLLQWENASGPVNRVAGFESSIVAVNSVPTDKTTGINRGLRKLGTFSGSSMISAPKPMPGGVMGTNQYWLWGNIATDQVARFDVKVPGVFLDPYYKDDIAIAPSGPLITKPETADFLKLDPCMEAGQKAGAYSMKCLNNLFVSSGGDPINGKLVKENGGLKQLNAKGDSDAISNYLSNLFLLVTTGKDRNGVLGSSTTINEAAQLMFGMDLMTPCEDVAQDAAGNIMLMKKLGSLEADCLDYLWMNTGSDRDRGDESYGSKTTLKNTYESIGARFSGLRKNEGSNASRKQYPFQTCQRSGTFAPVSKDGALNIKSIQSVNARAATARSKSCATNSRDPRCQTGSAVDFVQDFYNSIFKSANTSADASSEESHVDALAQCYGINKVAAQIPVPSTVPGLLIWYDGSDPFGNGTTPSDGTQIAKWVNMSGNKKYDAYGNKPATYSERTKSLLFDNSFYTINYSGQPTTNETFFVVFNNPTPNGGTRYILSGTYGGRSVSAGGTGSGPGSVGMDSPGMAWLAQTPAGSYTAGTTGLIVAYTTNTQTFIQLNGGQTYSDRIYFPYQQPNTLIGSYDGLPGVGNFYTGTISEIIIYNTTLSEANIQKVSKYLKEKWNL